MSSQNEVGIITVVTSAAISAWTRIQLNSSAQGGLASGTQPGIGIAQRDAGSGDNLPVRLYNAPGTKSMKANGAITAGSQVYPAANGLISGSAVANLELGIAREAATASGDIIEIVPTLPN